MFNCNSMTVIITKQLWLCYCKYTLSSFIGRRKTIYSDKM